MVSLRNNEVAEMRRESPAGPPSYGEQHHDKDYFLPPPRAAAGDNASGLNRPSERAGLNRRRPPTAA